MLIPIANTTNLSNLQSNAVKAIDSAKIRRINHYKMIEILRKIFGKKDHSALIEIIKNGAILLDVRSRSEFESGSVPQSINVPLNELGAQLNQWNTQQPIVVFCQSGMRSSQAKSILQARGFNSVHNAGSWRKLLQIMDNNS